MTDLEKAKEIFYSGNYSFVLVKNEDIISSSQKGIMQIVELIESGKDFTDYSLCDRIAGRAAAFLYILLGVKEVHSVKMTKLATNILDRAEIKFSADEYIEKVLPYVQTDFLFEEIANLKLKILSNGGLTVEKIVKKIKNELRLILLFT